MQHEACWFVWNLFSLLIVNIFIFSIAFHFHKNLPQHTSCSTFHIHTHTFTLKSLQFNVFKAIHADLWLQNGSQQQIENYSVNITYWHGKMLVKMLEIEGGICSSIVMYAKNEHFLKLNSFNLCCFATYVEWYGDEIYFFIWWKFSSRFCADWKLSIMTLYAWKKYDRI